MTAALRLPLQESSVKGIPESLLGQFALLKSFILLFILKEEYTQLPDLDP